MTEPLSPCQLTHFPRELTDLVRRLLDEHYIFLVLEDCDHAGNEYGEIFLIEGIVPVVLCRVSKLGCYQALASDTWKCRHTNLYLLSASSLSACQLGTADVWR